MTDFTGEAWLTRQARLLEIKVKLHRKVVDIADIDLKVTLRAGTCIRCENETSGRVAVIFIRSIVVPTVKRKDGSSAVIVDKPALHKKGRQVSLKCPDSQPPVNCDIDVGLRT